MTRKELVDRILQHERAAHVTFRVAGIQELADGILAVRDTDGEYCIFFDTSQNRIRDDAINKDTGRRIRGFPRRTGLIVDVTARSFADIARTAAHNLTVLGEGQVNWYPTWIAVAY